MIWFLLVGLVLVIWLLYAVRYPALPQSTLATIPPLFALTKADRLLVLAPHPDDETLAAAGLIQQAVALGGGARVIIVTDGNKWGKKLLRQKEVTQATSLCGLQTGNLIFWPFGDGHLCDNNELIEAINQEIKSYEPTMIVTTDSLDTHHDHQTLGRVVERLVADYPRINLLTALIHYHRFPRPIGLRPTVALLPPGRLFSSKLSWRRLTLTSTEQATKARAIDCFTSQLRTWFLRGLMLSFNRPNEIFICRQEGRKA